MMHDTLLTSLLIVYLLTLALDQIIIQADFSATNASFLVPVSAIRVAPPACLVTFK